MSSYGDLPPMGVASVASDTSHHLAEGPVWDPVRGRLLWVDILDGAVHVGSLTEDGRIVAQERIESPDTAAAVAVSARGELVIAGAHRLHYIDADGAMSSGRALINGDGRRFNDGKPDPGGRFTVGTKGPGPEKLIRVDPGEEVIVLDDDLGLSNGLGWSGDGRRMYSVDTPSRRIFVRDYDPGSGMAGARRVLVELDGDGYPDGLAVDAENHLWVAVWGAGCVVRITPAGDVVARVDVPAPHTSCPAFAGDDLGTLVITTATEDLTPEQARDYPLSGRLFTFTPGVRGAEPRLWSGRR
jgi:sugar lactone lactonase YvrE